MEIRGCDVANAGDWNFRSPDGVAKSDAGKDCDLVASVEPVNIQTGIGFSVARCLCLFQGMSKLNAVQFHLRKNVIACATYNSVNSLNTVRSQGFRDGADYRHASGDGSFNSQRKVLFLCQGKNLVTMQCDEGLIRRDHGLAAFE